jgi:hypothetical protein
MHGLRSIQLESLSETVVPTLVEFRLPDLCQSMESCDHECVKLEHPPFKPH